MSRGEMAGWIAAAHRAIYADDEPGGGPIDSFDWVYDPAFDARITIDGLDPVQRAAWMRDEIQTEIDDELDRGWGTMAEEDIQEPSIIVIVAGQAYCWDGNHRIGSRCIGADPYLPAIIGTPRATVKHSAVNPDLDLDLTRQTRSSILLERRA